MNTTLSSRTACRLLLAGLLMLASAGASAQLSCTITSAPPMAFGNYSPLSTINHDAQTSMNVRCTGSDVRLMQIRIGPGLAGTVGARVMRRNGVDFSYGLYINSGRTLAWGDGTAGTYPNLRIVGPGTDTTIQIYGRIPPRQNVPVGLYTDTVTVQVDW